MQENLQSQIEALKKENFILQKQAARLQSTIERNKAIAATNSRIESMRAVEKRRQEGYLKMLLDNSPNIIILLDKNGRFAYSTDTFLKAAGIESFGLINGNAFMEVMRPLLGEELSKTFSSALAEIAGGKKQIKFDAAIDFPSKRERTYVTYFTAAQGNESDFGGMIVMLLDSTDIRKAQENAERARADAERANKAKGDFLANMSHEIRTPINAIIGMTHIGKNAPDIAKKNYCFGKVDEASSHLLGIINDILDMSKIEAEKFALSMETFKFGDMLSRVMDIVAFKAREKRQRLSVDIALDMPPYLYGDSQHLAQVIANILSNSVKFTPEGGNINLRADMLGEENGVCEIKISVRDEGIGISKEQQANLFKPFSQAESGISRNFGGTGLGLAISKNIVEAMGGRIFVESELGRGAVFIFTAKIKRAQGNINIEKAAPAAAQAQDEGAANFAGKRALLAEDIDINREIVIELLKPTGIEIDEAITGVQAVNMFAAAPEKYDLILMDVQMPEMDGYEATRKIRSLDGVKAKTVPIIAMTANVFKEDVERALASGMNDHIGKSINLEELNRKLRKFLSGR
jgi:signal transduction histidine kinase